MIKHTFKVNVRQLASQTFFNNTKKLSKSHLSNVLNLETEYTDFRNSPYLDLVTLPDDPGQSASLTRNFPKFKVNWKAPENPQLRVKTNSPLFFTNTLYSEGPKSEERKPQAIFLSASRDKLQKLKLKVEHSRHVYDI